MLATLTEVKNLLRKAFPGAVVDQVREEQYRIFGSFLWQGFDGKDAEERNKLVTAAVRRPLLERGINVGSLLPLSPNDEL